MTIQRTILAGLVALSAHPAVLAAQEAGHGAEAGGGGLFSINTGLSIWTIVVFIGLLLILGRFAWGPILGALEAREGRIRESLEEAARRQEEAERLLEEHKRQLADARRQSQQIVAEGREAGEKVRRDIEEKARQEGQAIVERARREIEREKEAAIDELRRESVELALAAAAKLMQEQMDAPRDRKLVLDYVRQLERRGEEARA